MSGRYIFTGVEELDNIIGGGFPKGGLILISGNPGTGKTIFSARFLYRGAADYGENGVYVSFSEDRETFYENMKPFGFNFNQLEKEGRFRYLEMLATRELAIPHILEMILDEVNKIKAKRLVIDSFSAMAQAFERPYDVRILIHTVFSRIVRKVGCTTLMIIEVPFGEKRTGLGMEEFLADGVIHFRARKLEERLYRDMQIRKIRGSIIKEEEVGFTIDGGFRVFPPFKTKRIEKKETFKPLPDPPGKFSTGSEDLDQLLEGGYPKGSIALLEVGRNVSTQQYHLIIAPTAWNFLSKGAGVIVVPSSGVDYNIIWKKAVESGLPKEVLIRNLRVFTLRMLTTHKEPYIVIFEGENMEEDFNRYLKVLTELRKETSKPILHITGVERLIAHYGMNDTIKMLNLGATIIRENESLNIFILKPGYPRISELLNAIADVHLKIIREHGAVILYGLKPRTRLHFMQMNVSKGYPLPRLTPIV